MKLIHCGDLHLCGKNYNKSVNALNQLADFIGKNSVDMVIVSGDTLDRYNVSDRFASVGRIQKLLVDFIAKNPSVDYYFLRGNHDGNGQQEAGLEFLRAIPGVSFIDAPTVIGKDEVCIGLLPWIEKGYFMSTQCVGMDKTEADAKFTKSIHDVLGVFKYKFAPETGVKKLFFLHGDVQGVSPNDGYTVSGGQSFAFTNSQLHATGAEYVGASHIHKRIPPYVGALMQNSFGEEGNVQGFDYIEIKDNQITEQYIELDLPQFKTIEIHSFEDILASGWHKGWQYKLRFYSEDAFNKFDPLVIGGDFIIEKLWGKSDHVSRTEMELTAQMSEEDLLKVYIDLNPLPDGIKVEEVMGAAK